MYHKELLIYAIDSQNNFVYVDNVAKGLACNCYCPACKERLVAKNGGTKRIHHFAHASGVDCEGAYETMLHQLAKIRVQEAFLNKSEFYIQFKHTSYCSKVKSCRFVRDDNCYTATKKSFNLKKFYDLCEQEVKYDSINRRSDLKLYSSKNHQRPPIYIEFYVTHASDDFKLHNGGKVIEVKINSEKDIDKIVEQGFVESSKYNKINGYFEGISDTNDTTFWNFKAEDYNNTQICHKIEFSRYILYPSGKSQCYKDESSCKNLAKAQKHSLLEICFHKHSTLGIYQMAMWQGYERFGIKNCLYCRNYLEDGLYNNVCWINRNVPLDTTKARECPHFILYDDKMNEQIAHFNYLNPNEYTILLE